MLKNRLIYLAVLLLLGLFRIAYTGYVAGLLLVIALILPIFSWLISLPGAIFTRMSLSVPDQVIRGSEASITLRVRQSRLFSTGPVRGRLKTESVVSGEVSYARLRSVYSGFPLSTDHCCVYECSFQRFRIMDLLGLLPMPTHRPEPLSVTILPFPQEPPEHPDWAGTSTLVAKPFSGGENPYDLRDYRTGDTLKAVHWKKSAALDKTVVRDTLEPASRVAPIWIDWPQDPSGRDAALDQLAWCLIYLKQHNAGLLLQWLDTKGKVQRIYCSQGRLDDVMPQLLSQPAGQRADLSLLQDREILLSAGTEVRP
jgi:uncharacterized protein (DUF58 family)